MRAYVLIFALACSTPSLLQGLAQTSEMKARPVRGTTIVNYWPSSNNFLSALVKIGMKNRIPIGIVIEGNLLCTTRPTTSSEPTTIDGVVDELKSRIPDYTAEIRDGTLFVHPRAMTATTLETLNLEIPLFRTQPENIHAIRIALWMYIRAVLVPQQGSAFEGEIPRDAEALPAVQISNSTVQELLDRIVVTGGGGLWVLYRVPTTWLSNPATIPYDLYSYSGQQQNAEKISCTQ